jgi:hypothetical protein
MHFDDIPTLTKSGSYQVNVSWCFLLEYLKTQLGEYGLDLEPDFQRGHVWTEEQQVAYVEYALRDGAITGRDLYFNCPGWQRGGIGTPESPYVIVDGLQRLTAATKFLRNELRAYGHLHREFKGRLHLTGPQFIWHVNDLKTRAEVLQWYLEFNSGGTPHSQAELARVRKLLAQEK